MAIKNIEPGTPAYALQLVEECLKTKNQTLDLGNCGLEDADLKEGTKLNLLLCQCTHLDTIIFSNHWRDFKNKEEKSSQNQKKSPNKLTAIPWSVGKLAGLKTLILSGKNEEDFSIKEIQHLEGLTQLQYLDLSHNQIQKLNSLEKLSCLITLDINDNKIQKLECLMALTNLQYFDISMNQISKLEGMETLKNLKIFNISMNQIQKLEGMETLTKLQDLNISMNQIQKIEGLEELSILHTFDISNNQIKKLEGLFSLSNLLNFNISHNQVQKLEGLEDLKSLKTFYIYRNQIKKLEGLHRMNNLKIFFISDNKIQKLEGLDGLFGLQTFEIYNNEIKTLEGLDNLKELKDFIIGWEKIQNVPKEILDKGLLAIREYLIKEKQPLNECKLIFVGDGGVGKTSLMKRLVFDTFDPAEKTTHGINKLAWTKLKDQNNKPVKVNLWDFGGQHIQHSLHQFFFSQRVVYVLVLNPRNDQKADYWLEQIDNLGSDSEILLVYNWKDSDDKKADYMTNFYELRKKYPKLKDPSEVSCLTGDGITQFRDKALEAILANEGLRTEYPKDWFTIKARLETEIPIESNYVNYDLYVDWCKQADYNDPEAQKRLLSILDSVGSIVFFDKPILNQLQVLNPEWITTGAYAIITSEVTKKKQGQLSEADLIEIFKEEKEIFSDKAIKIKYEQRHFQFIIELMVEYRLCQKRQQGQITEYLIPSAFGEKPSNDYQPHKAKSRHYRFDLKAPFELLIMHQFIALHIPDLQGKDYWQSGIYFKHSVSNTYALVETDQYSKVINCWIEGENIAGLWEVIRNDFALILKPYKKLNYDEQVKYRNGEIEAFLSYAEMQAALKEKINIIQYDPATRMKNIDVLNVLSYFTTEKPKEREMEEKQPRFRVEVNPNIQVNPVFENKPLLENDPIINTTVNDETKTGDQKTHTKSEKELRPEDLKKVKKWRNMGWLVLGISLACSILLSMIYTGEWIFDPSIWIGIKQNKFTDIGAKVGLFLLNFVVSKFWYDRVLDPSKKKAFLDNLRSGH